MALDGLRVEDGEKLAIHSADGTHVNVRAALTDASIERTMGGVSTVSISIFDPEREFVNSRFLNPEDDEPAQVEIGVILFKLVRISKRGSRVELTFEDWVTHALKKKEGELTAEAGEITRSGFATRLMHEVPDLRANYVEDSGPASVQFARKEDENSWETIKRLADDRDWRAFSTGGGMIFASDQKLLERGGEPFRLQERTSSVDSIDFSLDVGGQPDGVSVKARAQRWQVPPGHPAQITGLERLKGDWLVSSIQRGLFTHQATVKLVRPLDGKPEPEEEDSSTP